MKIILSIIIFFLAFNAQAQFTGGSDDGYAMGSTAFVYIWNGSSDANWTNIANWTPESPVGGPGVGDNVVVVVGAPNNLTSIPAGINIKRLTITSGVDITLAGSLTVTENLIISANSLQTAAHLLSVSGTTTVGVNATIVSSGGNKTFTGATTNAGTINMSSTTVSLGDYSGGGTFTTNNATDITFTNTGAVTFNATSFSDANNVIKNGGGTLTLGRDLAIAGTLTVNNGTFNTNSRAVTVTSTTTIAGTGILSSSSGVKTFNGLVTNNAILSLSGSTATMTAGLTNASGTTTVGTSLVVTGAVLVNGGIVNTAGGIFTVNGNTTIAGAAQLTATGGVKTFTAGDVSNTGTMTMNGSTVNLANYSGAGVFNSNTSTTLNLSNAALITFQSGSLANLNTLNLNGGGGVTISSGLNISNALNVAAGTFTTAAVALSVGGATVITTTLNSTGGTKTFSGAFTNNGIITLPNTTAIFGNTFTNTATFTTDNTTHLSFTGTTAVSLPSGAPRALASLTINKASGNVSLTSNLNLGNAGGTVLTISGAAHLDLAGLNVSMQNADDVISELSSAGTIINSGVIGAYIETLGTLTTTQVNSSGIGIFNISPANATANHRVRRYPQKATYLINCTETITRIYEFIGDMTGIASFSLRYAVSETDGAPAGSLNVFRSAAIPFALPTYIITSDAYANPFGAASVSTLPVNGEFYTLVSVDPAKGITKTFTGAIDTDWDKEGNWDPPCIPEFPDFAIIPNGKTVVTTNNISAATITLNGNATLNVGHNAVIAGRSDGGIFLNGTSALTVSAAIDLEIGTDEYRGDIEMNENSSLTFSGGGASNVTLSGTWTKAANATLINTVPPTFNFVGQTPLILPITLRNAVNVNIDKFNSSVTLSDDLSIVQNLDITRGTFIIGNNDFEVTGTTGIAANATLNADYSDYNSTRIFTGIVTINGTLTSSGSRHTDNTTPTYNNTFTAAMNIPTTGTLNLNYSRAKFSSTLATAGSGNTFNALGSDIRFFGAITWTSLAFNTNDNTDLTFSCGAGQDLLAFDVKDLTIADAQTYTMTGDISLTGNFTSTAAGTLILGANKLTVGGIFSNNAGFTINPNNAASTLILNGAISSWGLMTDANDVNLNLTIGGSGTITPLTMDATVDALRSLTMSRAGANLQFAGGDPFAIGTDLNISAGTVTVEAGQTFTVTGETTIGSNGTLVTNGATTVTFNGAVTGTGTIDADHADDELIVTSGNFTFSGNLITASTTILTFNTTLATVSLPSSVTNLEELRLLGGVAHNVTLNSNLTLADQLAATNLLTPSIYTVNGYTLTLTGGIATATSGTIVATSSSTLSFGAAVDFTNIGITEDETTNLIFTGAASTTALSTAITQCNNLTQTGANTVAITATGLTVNGNLSVGNGCAFNKATFNLTVYGDVSNAGIMALIGAGGTITLHGQLSGAGMYIASGFNTQLVIAGTGSQFIMPTGLTIVNDLTINRNSGAKLNVNFTVGTATAIGVLTLTDGDLDLNGYTLTFAYTDGATAQIAETAGNTVINTGASGSSNGYITLSTTTLANIEASGIGIVELSAAGNVQVRRYPITVPIAGVGLSTKRVFQISGNSVTAATFEFDNSELYSSASDLKLFTATSTDIAFANATAQTLANGSNRTIPTAPSGKGRVKYSLMKETPVAAGSFYALASAPSDGGVLRIASGSGNWGNPAIWSPAGIPTKLDQVVIGPATVTLNGNGVTYEAKTLVLNHANATLQANDNGINGDITNLLVMGDIEIASGAEILGVNGRGRLNLIIGDGLTTGVSSNLSVNNDYVPTSGVWLNNLTVNTADLQISGSNNIRISGDIALIANSDVQIAKVEFWGGYDNNQTISLPTSANLTLETAIFDNYANVTTQSDFTLKNHFLVKSGSSLNAQAGSIYFTTPNGAGTPWNVESGATLKLNNVEFNSSAVQTFEPIGTAYIQGNFLQYNTADFAPSSGRIIFSNTSQKEIVNTQAIGDLKFFEIELSSGSKVITSNSWRVAKEIDVKAGASLIAENGTIEMIGTAPLYIKNASTQTLEFNNLTISSSTYTSDSWTIKGDLLANALLKADKGTITFDNIQVKTITPAVEPTFFKVKISDGAKVTTAAPYHLTFANNSTNPSGAGIEVAGAGEFYSGDPSGEVRFDVGIGVVQGYPKTIAKSADGRLEFGLIRILASPNNEVATASDFTLTGTGAGVFNNLGAGGKFTATAGIVTFTGSNPQIASVSPGVSQFYGIRTIGATELTFPNTAQEIYIAGDVRIDGQSSIAASANIDCKVVFNGNSSQNISGNTTALTPISLADVVINKSENSELILGLNTIFGSNANHELTLSNGILNLGEKTLTCGAGIISRINGAINGNKGTYLVAANHAPSKLEDVYFTIAGLPTLYNLTLNEAHTTANDLTINGMLNLNTGNLTIASGASPSSPIKLILNGDLSRTSGVITSASPANSRLVLQGSGTVAGGLSNTYFGGNETTTQLEIARAEALGGNLQINDATPLRINCGINDFNLGSYTLTFETSFSLVMISGGIKAGTNSSVIIPVAASIPASMFRNDEVYNLSLAGETSLEGHLKINGTLSLTGNFNIITNNNILTFAQNAVLPTFSAARHIVGKVRRYVTNNLAEFPIGNGSSYSPVSLQFANTGSVQPILISVLFADPTANKGGRPENSVDVLWSISPEGAISSDSIKAVFGWSNALDGGTLPTANASFPAKWSGTNWLDYRNRLIGFTPTSQRTLAMNGFALANSSALKGEWAVFNATANTDAAKDEAISSGGNRIVFTSIDPTPVVLNNAFKVTVQLQDSFGKPIETAVPFAFSLSKTALSVGTFSNVNGVIPPGESMLTLSGLSITTTAGGDHQLLVDSLGGSSNWAATVSELFDVLPIAPTSQARNISFANIGATSMTINWTNGTGSRRVVLIKPDTLLQSDEFPVAGNTYFANTIVGASSNIGNASVVYNGAAQTVDITGLAANTTYFVYVFEYNGEFGKNEHYRTTAASGNPKSVITTGSYDDDITFGENNSRATSKAIGTNTPIRATIRSRGDEDWFNFTVSNVSPNLRAQIYDLPGNYTMELYDASGRRIRRSNLSGTQSEAAVINNLPSGTYSVRIFSQDGSCWTRDGEEYILKINTYGSEIFSVTP